LLTRRHAKQALEDLEARSEPALFREVANAWPALVRWPGRAGVEYLNSLHGDTIVDVAISGDQIFSGDVRRAQSVSVPLRTFLKGNVLEFASESHAGGGRGQGTDKDGEGEREKGDSDARCAGRGNDTGPGEYTGKAEKESHASPFTFYLAQCPIFNNSAANRKVEEEAEGAAASGSDTASNSCLYKLMADVLVPDALGAHSLGLCSMNLWMCGEASGVVTSTLHYDGHNNLLVCLSGSKTVKLFPPDHSECLAALHPAFALSSNHCHLLDHATRPRWQGGISGTHFTCFTSTKVQILTPEAVVVRGGDALFIPEGWFHQVEYATVTIA
jgi:hypothetical protein